jgi:hypothetical protein
MVGRHDVPDDLKRKHEHPRRRGLWRRFAAMMLGPGKDQVSVTETVNPAEGTANLLSGASAVSLRRGRHGHERSCRCAGIGVAIGRL